MSTKSYLVAKGIVITIVSDFPDDAFMTCICCWGCGEAEGTGRGQGLQKGCFFACCFSILIVNKDKKL